jgi:hypothetical protein
VELLRERAPTWLVQLPWLVAEEERASLETRVVGVTRDRMLREIVEVLEAFSADEPAVLVLEDLHWADYSTLDLLDVIARRFEPARLLVLGTFRPAEARSAGHPLRGLVQSLRVRNLCAEVALGSLSESATHALLVLHLDGTDPGGEVAALLHSRTSGNPLYMEKLVEAWIDEGALTRESGVWVVARDLDELARSVPETLRSLIEQRCAALEPDAHLLLEAVSVAGAEFASATAAAAAEMDEDEAERRLRDVALDATFIRAIGDDEWPDGTISTRYGFTHDLVYETLQERLPAGQRARVHRRIGDRLEAAHADRVDEIALFATCTPRPRERWSWARRGRRSSISPRRVTPSRRSQVTPSVSTWSSGSSNCSAARCSRPRGGRRRRRSRRSSAREISRARSRTKPCSRARSTGWRRCTRFAGSTSSRRRCSASRSASRPSRTSRARSSTRTS